MSENPRKQHLILLGILTAILLALAAVIWIKQDVMRDDPPCINHRLELGGNGRVDFC